MLRSSLTAGTKVLVAAMPILLGASAALAQDAAPEAAPAVEAVAAVSTEAQFILNTFSFLVCGALVMWMTAGFAMVEAGLVRKRSVGAQCLKNIGLFAIACIMYLLVGYNLMYTDVTGYIGSFTFLYGPSDAELALIGGGEDTAAVVENGYAVMSDWFFQVVFVATAASIISGTVAERIKIGPFFLFVAILTGFIYPIAGSWQWGGGWLSEMGFSDFAGSTLVHSVGGWAALAGAILVGPRIGKFGPGGRINPMPGSSLPLATLGTIILWMGWFGFNGGSQLALGTAGDAAAMANIFANTNLAACGGVVAVMVLMSIMYGKIDLTMVLNGALAGLVAITAEPLNPSPILATIIGAVGGVIIVFTVPLLDKLRIDDVVGAVSVHLFAGVWGTMAVPLSNGDTSFVTQAIGVVAYGVFTFVCSLVVFGIIKMIMGLRLSEEDEAMGIDQTELGMEAYPEFGQTSAA
ncbi:ammonium transporter [Marinivivus vitaminiproducens]|uniref:ammonium transporter n=1 Tax=Marinivivus vitaminiproducens TaxID=3035935 RepID=UPI0027A348F9|nr:ammonium transporter [Geminicoccaceae bacterium SCSIO 64248]